MEEIKEIEINISINKDKNEMKLLFEKWNLLENNEIAFVVRRSANKMQIKRAFVDLYEEEVERVNTHITPKGEKVAYIKLVEEEMAEELAVRIGVF